jgi:hypothetical protein
MLQLSPYCAILDIVPRGESSFCSLHKIASGVSLSINVMYKVDFSTNREACFALLEIDRQQAEKQGCLEAAT